MEFSTSHWPIYKNLSLYLVFLRAIAGAGEAYWCVHLKILTRLESINMWLWWDLLTVTTLSN